AAVMALGCSAANDFSDGENSQAAGAGASGATGTGNTGTGNTGTGNTGTGGMAPTDAGPKDDVTFDWPESTGPCRGGHYQGAYECMYVYQGGAPIAVNGTVDFFLQPTMNGEFFDIGNGKLNSVSNGVFVM